MGGLDRFFDIGGGDEPQEVSNRIWTVPNLLSLARILVLPWIAIDLVAGRFLRALVVLAIFAATDWLDGYVARRFDQVTRLGQLLDPISDRALFLVVGIGFVLGDLLPLWALLILLVHDVLVMGGGGLLLLRGQRPPEVTRVGKTATFVLMFAFPLFLGAAVIGDGAADPQPVIQVLAWAAYTVGAVLYWVSAVGYVRTMVGGHDSGAEEDETAG
jgi:cardiolipin synthase (CMP-forming)